MLLKFKHVYSLWYQVILSVVCTHVWKWVSRCRLKKKCYLVFVFVFALDLYKPPVFRCYLLSWSVSLACLLHGCWGNAAQQAGKSTRSHTQDDGKGGWSCCTYPKVRWAVSLSSLNWCHMTTATTLHYLSLKMMNNKVIYCVKLENRGFSCSTK